jgi:TfoX/Sxy family transcriptional regulator of competence genes
MPFNEKLADRTRELIAEKETHVIEKKMFGGLCFMVNDKMCVGIEKDRLMVRINPDDYDNFITKDGVGPMDFTGKVMKGFVFVSEEFLNTKSKLKYWIDLALDYNKTVNLIQLKNKK